ncbi:hypothetical protein IQ274_36090 [Nostoc sp. LEGE 12447]|uniref:hypothetical protein n=1 Tax=Nostoc sp. LEGE 12447 TaxID=1828640 RepID=UPI001883D17C|nr:hypothetical protein [Nostoc sp. LEGE 12447]MBE9003429.1 hypothetical protein [Nostoc sp. LEGE 12447]
MQWLSPLLPSIRTREYFSGTVVTVCREESQLKFSDFRRERSLKLAFVVAIASGGALCYRSTRQFLVAVC